MADTNVDLIQDPYAKKDNTTDSQGAGSVPSGVAPQAPTGATGSAGGSGTSGQQGGGSTGKTGSGFVNIQNVLNANKQGGQQLGQTIGSGIQQTASDVGQGLGTAQQQFGAQSAAGTLGSDTDKSNVQNVLGSLNNYQGANTASVNTTGQGPNASSTPTYAGLTQQNIDDFAKYRAGAYTGPQQLGGVDLLSQQAQQAEQLGRNINTAGGQQQLLQQFVGQGQNQYGQGAQSLDQLLLGASGAQPLQQARQATVGLAGQVQGANQAAEEQAKAATSQSQQFGTDVSQQLQNLIQAQQTAGTSARDAANKSDTQTQANYNNIIAGLQSGAQKGQIADPASILTALQPMQQQGLITADQAKNLQTIATKGIIDPKVYLNNLYIDALNNPTGNYFGDVTGGPRITNQQAIDQGLLAPKYTSAQSVGLDLPTLLQNTLSEQTQGSTIDNAGKSSNINPLSFLNAPQQAQYNALEQLSGQTPTATNLPTYTAAKNSFDYNNFLNKLGPYATGIPTYYNGGLVMPKLKSMWKK